MERLRETQYRQKQIPMQTMLFQPQHAVPINPLTKHTASVSVLHQQSLYTEDQILFPRVSSHTQRARPSKKSKNAKSTAGRDGMAQTTSIYLTCDEESEAEEEMKARSITKGD